MGKQLYKSCHTYSRYWSYKFLVSLSRNLSFSSFRPNFKKLFTKAIWNDPVTHNINISILHNIYAYSCLLFVWFSICYRIYISIFSWDLLKVHEKKKKIEHCQPYHFTLKHTKVRATVRDCACNFKRMIMLIGRKWLDEISYYTAWDRNSNVFYIRSLYTLPKITVCVTVWIATELQMCYRICSIY